MLATLADGTPEASLVTPGCLPDLGFALLLSRLSRHTSALQQTPRCSLLLVGSARPPEGGPPNPQTTPRLSLRGHAIPDPDPALRRRYLAIHPYATPYAGFTDFLFYRFVPEAARLVAGFGLARSFTPEALLGAARPVPDFLAREAAALAQAAPLRATIAAVAARLLGRPVDEAHLVAIDPDGADLIIGTARTRLDWDQPLTDPTDLNPYISRLADQPCVIPP